MGFDLCFVQHAPLSRTFKMGVKVLAGMLNESHRGLFIVMRLGEGVVWSVLKSP